jgi:glutathione synthase/RimK-type ligase-like ATP-grasp enzyme
VAILILGTTSDAHAAHMHRALEAVGADVYYWDTSGLPSQMQLSWEPTTGTGVMTLPSGKRLTTAEIDSIFWRQLLDVHVPTIGDAYPHYIAANDTMGLLRTWLQIDSIRWVNSWQAFQFHKEKPRQLAAVHQQGVNIPATLVSNCPEQIQAFAQHHNKLIFKPVYGGAHTQFVTEAHLQPERLHQVLKLSPVTIQAYIAGTNIRSYVIGDAVFSAEIQSTELDFRADRTAQLIPHSLPTTLENQCRHIARNLFLQWTAIDWRLTPQGEYIFLEANPSPMFLHFEQVTGFPMTQYLVDLLTSKVAVLWG